MKPVYRKGTIECSQSDVLSSESGIETESDHTDVDSPLPNVESCSQPWKLHAIAETSRVIVSRRRHYRKMAKANDDRSLCDLPSHHWKCSLSVDSRDNNCWKKADIETLVQTWDKLYFFPELPKDIEFSRELCRYYRVELP